MMCNLARCMMELNFLLFVFHYRTFMASLFNYVSMYSNGICLSAMTAIQSVPPSDFFRGSEWPESRPELKLTRKKNLKKITGLPPCMSPPAWKLTKSTEEWEAENYWKKNKLLPCTTT